MYEKDLEERVDALEKRFDDFRAEVEAAKQKPDEEPTLIPGAEYDFVPSVEEKVIARGTGRIVRIEKASHELGLSAREWELLSEPGDNHE